MTMNTLHNSAIDANRALKALVSVFSACRRHVLVDVVVSWIALCEAVDRVDLLAVTVEEPKFSIELGGNAPYAFEDLALDISNAIDTGHEEYWRQVATKIMIGSWMAARVNGLRAEYIVKTWKRDLWTVDDNMSEDGRPLTEADEDDVVAYVRKATFFARFVMGQYANPKNAAYRSQLQALKAVDAVVGGVLSDLDIVALKPSPRYIADGRVLVCSVCEKVEDHTDQCPVPLLNAAHLIRVYNAALRGERS